MPFRTLIPLVLLAAPLSAQSLDDIILPRKTEFFIALQRSLNSKAVNPGDKFSAIVEVPVTHNDQVVIPVGTFIIGHVSDTHSAGRLKGKAQLLLAFDTIILPNGITRNMRAAVQSAEGYKTDLKDEEGEIQAAGSQKKEVLVGAAGGAVTGAITGVIIGAAQRNAGRGLALGSAVGAAGGALLALLQKGSEVELPKGTSLTIQLQEDVEFVKPQPPPRGTELKP